MPIAPCVDIPELLFIAAAGTFAFFVRDYLYDIIETSILPFFSLLTGTNINQKVSVIKNGNKAPYSENNLAIDDPSAVYISWGRLVGGTVRFFVTMGTVIGVLWLMCFFFSKNQLSVK